LEVPDGVVEPVRVGECNGDSLIGDVELGPFDETSAFSLPVIASDIARRPEVRLFLPKKEWLCLISVWAGDGDARPVDDASLLGRCGDEAIASMLGELPYSSFVTVGDKSLPGLSGRTKSKPPELRCPRVFALVP
jgi:hypothetical protein